MAEFFFSVFAGFAVGIGIAAFYYVSDRVIKWLAGRYL